MISLIKGDHHMGFDPNNPIIRYCMQGVQLEEQGKPEQASQLFHQAWHEASCDFEKFVAAYYIARHQSDDASRLAWSEIALKFAQSINDENVISAYPALYTNIAKCHVALGNNNQAIQNHQLTQSFKDKLSDKGPFYHGTRANLQVDDLLTAGFKSNYNPDIIMNHIYFTALPSGAVLAAALADGDLPERIYIVEPTGHFEHDPNVTDKKFPGNPTRSYRSQAPLKIVGELSDWVKMTPEQLQQWREKVINNKDKPIIN